MPFRWFGQLFFAYVAATFSTTAGTSRTQLHPHGPRISEQRDVVIVIDLITSARQAPRADFFSGALQIAN